MEDMRIASKALHEDLWLLERANKHLSAENKTLRHDGDIKQRTIDKQETELALLVKRIETLEQNSKTVKADQAVLRQRVEDLHKVRESVKRLKDKADDQIARHGSGDDDLGVLGHDLP
jgi:ribosomal protein S15P/S13E